MRIPFKKNKRNVSLKKLKINFVLTFLEFFNQSDVKGQVLIKFIGFCEKNRALQFFLHFINDILKFKFLKSERNFQIPTTRHSIKKN